LLSSRGKPFDTEKVQLYGTEGILKLHTWQKVSDLSADKPGEP